MARLSSLSLEAATLAFQSGKAAPPIEDPGFTAMEKRLASGRKKKVLAHRQREPAGDMGSPIGTHHCADGDQMGTREGYWSPGQPLATVVGSSPYLVP